MIVIEDKHKCSRPPYIMNVTVAYTPKFGKDFFEVDTFLRKEIGIERTLVMTEGYSVMING